MKLKKALLRWYKSFHLNYRGDTEKGETKSYRPWNSLSPEFAKDEVFPFIEISIEDDITTIVGANESGKSHLLNAVTKVFRGTATDDTDKYKRTDLCHYAGIRTRNVEACPHIGLQFAFDNDKERRSINEIVAGKGEGTTLLDSPSFTFILEPEDELTGKGKAFLFIEPNPQAFSLSQKQCQDLREHLPSIQFIQSDALLASEIPLASLISLYGETAFASVGLLDRKSVEQAAHKIQSLQLPTGQPPDLGAFATTLESVKSGLKSSPIADSSNESLELLLFRDILDITPETLKYIYTLPITDRGYVEGQIAKWNEAINDKLNLAHFWHQDELFSLTVDYKDGIIYFEIRDKTQSVYTFKERSSGLKFFLSYYIQAKAMELTHRNRNSLILMDEPDSALSIIGQRNLLAVFESLVSPESSNQTCQLIYTTHSPYLINRNFPRRIRVVKKEDAEEGTQYIEQARARRYEPVRTALGIDSAPSLFLGADNILMEGATDQFLLAEMIRVFATPTNVGEFLDLNAVIIVSADGIGNVQNVLEQSHWADEPIPPTAVLVDSDAHADEVVKTITEPRAGKGPIIDGQFVSQIGKHVSPFDSNAAIVTTEDIVPTAIYKAAIDAYMNRWLPATIATRGAEIKEDLSVPTFGAGGLVAATEAFFKKYKPEFKGDYDKMGVFQEVVAIATARVLDFDVKRRANPELKLDADMLRLKANVVAICDFIRDALAKSRAITTKFSTTQAIKRIIHDFNRLNKLNVAITALQKLFRRLELEASSIGTDADQFLHLVNQYSTELDTLRAAGQERIAGEQWKAWEARLAAMKKNPLAASVEVSSPESAGTISPIETSVLSDGNDGSSAPPQPTRSVPERPEIDQADDSPA